MGLVCLNLNRNTGYAFCWSDGPVTIVATTASPTQDLSFYREFDERSKPPVWIYLPVAEDELVSHVYTRVGKDRDHLGLIVRHTLISTYRLDPG